MELYIPANNTRTKTGANRKNRVMEAPGPPLDGDQGGHILWGTITGTSWRDPGGTTTPHNIKRRGG